MQDTTEKLTRRGPGKYEFLVDEILDGITLAGADDSCGDVDEVGLHASLIRGRVRVGPPLSDVVPETFAQMSFADVAWILAHRAGFIVLTDSNGFVTVTGYKESHSIERDWSELETDLSIDDDDDGEADS